MKKMVVMLLGVVAAINAMAIDFTAKAKVTLTAESGYTCNLMLSEYAAAGALSGSEINMDGRRVALYALNGASKYQIAQAADLSNVKLGLLTDASTNYTLTVSAVEGTETLYIRDNVANADYALTEGASYNFTATASTTDETRFYLKKGATELDVCFINNVLTINANPENEAIVITDADGNAIAGSPFAAATPSVDFATIGAAGDRFTVEIGARKFIIVKQ